MRLPNCDKAIVSDRKLREYVLSETHPVGRHHARLFRVLLGITVEQSQTLQELLLNAAASDEATLGQRSPLVRSTRSARRWVAEIERILC